MAAADRVDEGRVERDAIRRDPDSWVDPRSWLSDEERAKYYRRHETMSEDEIDRLEAENAERGYAYEPGPFEDLDDSDELKLEELRDDDVPPPSGVRNTVAYGPLDERPSGPDDEQSSYNAGVRPSTRALGQSAVGSEAPTGWREDEVSATSGETLEYLEPRSVRRVRAEFGDSSVERPEATGEELLERNEDETSRAEQFGRRYLRTAGDVKQATDDVSKTVAGIVRPSPTGSGTETRSPGSVYEQHPEPASAGSALTGLVGLGVLLYQAGRLGWQYGRRTEREGAKDAGDR